MKKKLFSILLIAVMVLTSFSAVFAQEVAYKGTDGDNATITIENAAKGETYTVVKLFDATVTGTNGGSIAYQGTVPDDLSDLFEADAKGNVSAKKAAFSDEDLATLKAWAVAQNPTASVESDGSELSFKNLPYGYYIVTSTQGAAVTINSTNPNVKIYDKNSKDLGIKKEVDDKDVRIGQKVEYTATFNTVNFIGEGADAEKVMSYTIADTLPDFLKDVEITGLTIDGKGVDYTAYKEAFKTSKQFIIPWVDENNNHIYKNGAVIVLKYKATVTEKIKLGLEGNAETNKNTVSLQPNKDKDGNEPFDDKLEDTENIYSYAVALQKVDENKKPLANAKFMVKGLTANGSAGEYTVESYNPTGTDGTILECDDDGQLVILGLDSDAELVAVETEAPDGYNKLVEDVKFKKPVKTSEEIKKTEKTIYYDANGNVTDEVTSVTRTKTTYNVEVLKAAIVVENHKGTTMPETGGMGTTIIYILGAALVIGAGVMLVTRKKMDD